MPLALLTASGPAAAAGPRRRQWQGWGGGLRSRGRCWGPWRCLCFADSEAACLQRHHPYPGRTPALEAEGERWSITGSACWHPNARHIQPPPSTAVPRAARARSWGQLHPSVVQGIMVGTDGPEELSKRLASPAPSPSPRAPPSTLHQTLCLERPKNHNSKVLR